MEPNADKFDVYLEIGKKRTIAGAIEWPGWCRVGRDADTALQALVDYAPRYGRVLSATSLGFQAPLDRSAFAVVERLEGNATTDFGAPDASPSTDTQPVGTAELQRLQTLLRACWQAFDQAVQAATGKELRKGPRGGGRDLDEITRHVLGGDASYLARLTWKLKPDEMAELSQELSRSRRAVLDALEAAARGELPAHGPRGGAIWTPRYFVRRVSWHVLDHAWEIEDRVD